MNVRTLTGFCVMLTCAWGPFLRAQESAPKPETPIEKWTGKTAMLIGAHADDDALPRHTGDVTGPRQPGVYRHANHGKRRHAGSQPFAHTIGGDPPQGRISGLGRTRHSGPALHQPRLRRWDAGIRGPQGRRRESGAPDSQIPT